MSLYLFVVFGFWATAAAKFRRSPYQEMEGGSHLKAFLV